MDCQIYYSSSGGRRVKLIFWIGPVRYVFEDVNAYVIEKEEGE